MELFIALRYIRGRKKLGFISLFTWISVIGVMLGSLVLVVALAIANGFEKEVRDRIVGTLAHAKIMRFHGTPIENYDSLMTEILKHPQVKSAAPYISGKGGVECDKVQEAVLVMGVDADRETTVTDIGSKIKYGAFNLDSAESNKKRKLPCIIIGLGLADRLGIRPGSELFLMTLVAVDGMIDPTPRTDRFVVSGVFETGMYEYDLNLVYISVPSAQGLFAMSGVEGIQIRTTDLFAADRIARDVQEYLGGYPYRSLDWKTQNRSLFEWIALEKIVIFIVISLIIVVAAFNIFSSLLMLILEKRRQIGILMGMGATQGAIVRVFMFNGMVIGALGSTIGTILGVVICFVQQRWKIIPIPGDIYFVNKLPMLIQWFDVVIIYIAANAVCMLATIYPALQAAKILPAESMRYE